MIVQDLVPTTDRAKPVSEPADAPAHFTYGSERATTTTLRTGVLLARRDAAANVLTKADLEDQVVRLNLGLADGIANRYCGRGVERDDLVQVARLGLVKAVHRFHSDRGVAFPAFATPTITGEVKRHFRDHGWAVRPPRRLQELHARVGPTSRDLEQRLHRPPTAPELATELGVAASELDLAQEAATAFTTLSFDYRPSDDSPSLSQVLPAEGDDLDLVEDRVALSAAIGLLNRREQVVVAMRFGQDLTQAEIAHHLGVSQMQVSRILTRLLAQLRDVLAPTLGQVA
ncbi:sigma-70 family RNA polymerase sigma factor [Lapillicoccus sp.]|uniref:sigma-70 family RNA polymerase sigma factor n=1 Tax=Lapillicoccus sp. TaxID=1909287 RepID=UPI0025F8973E|nr:sigma-70 family RNA polymerase sigma factor [Lapillicoccus sp.]